MAHPPPGGVCELEVEYIEGAGADQALDPLQPSPVRGFMDRLVLASGSPSRLALLRAAGLSVESHPSFLDESCVTITDPGARAQELGRLKASAVRSEGAWILGADQVVWDPETGEIFGKPESEAAHLARLRGMRGRAHHLITGFALLGPDTVDQGQCVSVVTIRSDLEDAELKAYVSSGEGAACAGGYAAEGLGSFLIERVDGDWNNVLGLPLFQVLGCLRRRGWRFPYRETAWQTS